MPPLTAEQRVERAKKASIARWAKVDWAKMPLDEAQVELAELREEYERALYAIQQRMIQPAVLYCFICKSEIPSGKFVQQIVYRDKTDQLIKTIYFDKAACVSQYNKLDYQKRYPDAQPIKDGLYLPK